VSARTAAAPAGRGPLPVAAPALEAVLRSLKLPGMADMLGERLAQGAAGGLGHAEVLALLAGDEQTRREGAGLARRLAAAHFEATCAVEDFDFAYNPDIPAGTVRDLAGLGFLSAGQSVILHGPVGVGKTMLAQALGQLVCRRGHTVAFTKTSRLLADLAGGHADRTWATRLRRWARPALLICDDFAMRELTLPQADDLYELVTERAGRSIIATSNRAPADWYPLSCLSLSLRWPPCIKRLRGQALEGDYWGLRSRSGGRWWASGGRRARAGSGRRPSVSCVG